MATVASTTLRLLKLTVALAAVNLCVPAPARGATEDQLAAMQLSLHTGNPITVAEKGREDQFYFEIANPRSNAAVVVRLHLSMTDYAGRTYEWTSDELSLSSNERSRVPLVEAIPGVGWWRVKPKLLSAKGDATAEKATRELAYIEPVGPRSHPPADGFWFGLDSRVRSPEMIRLFASMGVDILRYGTWAGVNPEEREYAWEEYDRVLHDTRAAGLQTLFSVVFTPEYAVLPKYRGKGNASRRPPRPEALRESLKQIIAHNRDKGQMIYDLWNEPDHRGFWHGSTDEYLDFMRVAYETIKSVQPDATVLSGGIASLHQGRTDSLNPDMDRRLIREGQKWYDALSLHEHGSFRRFAEALDGPLVAHRAPLAQPKPLWFTETGHNGDGRAKAAVLVQKITYARAHGAQGMIWYALYPPGQGGKFNIIDPQGDPQPVIPAYAHMVRMMRGMQFARAYDDKTGTGNRLFAFEGDGQTLLIAWGSGATACRAVVELTHSAEARAFDIMGRPLALERSGDTLSLPFAETPYYVEAAGKIEVGEYEHIPPIALFEFGSLNPSAGAAGVTVSSLQRSGWTHHNVQDQDERMARSASGNPNASFDGEGEAMHLRFSVTPADEKAIDFSTLSFWGNSGAFHGMTITLHYQVGEAVPVKVGTKQLANLSAPAISGEFHSFPLSSLEGVTERVAFTLTASRNGERVILKIDDLRVDGIVQP